MNHVIVIFSLLSALVLAACDKQPVVVNVPATPVAVPGPAGPQGATGSQGDAGKPGYDGVKGDTGKTGETPAIIIMPTASEPAK